MAKAHGLITAWSDKASGYIVRTPLAALVTSAACVPDKRASYLSILAGHGLPTSARRIGCARTTMPQQEGTPRNLDPGYRAVPLQCCLKRAVVSGAQIANGPGPADGTPNNLDDIYTPGETPARPRAARRMRVFLLSSPLFVDETEGRFRHCLAELVPSFYV